MNITVVGDVLLDIDKVGSAVRLSPDAPVPIVDVDKTIRRAGGAGLVATLLARDGLHVDLVTSLSADASSAEVRACLEDTGPGSVRLVASSSSSPTPVKTRLRGSGHSIARFDEGCGPAPSPDVTEEMIAGIRQADAIVVADYGRGLTSNQRLRAELERLGARIPIVWDPHPRGAPPVANCAIATPNRSEAASAANVPIDGIAAATAAATTLRSAWGCSIAITLGDQGALLLGTASTNSPLAIPAPPTEVADPCGAGDRFAGTVARQLAAGTSLAGAVRIGISEASAFLGHGGVASLDRPANALPIGGQAVDALDVANRVRRAGGKVVATGGCFDLLHAGHARALTAARALGDCLIVCLNSDDSVRRLKGSGRPIMNQEDRCDLLLALECVDAVLVFDEDTPESVIRRLEPDIWAKGGDYIATDLPEARAVAESGGQTVTVPYYPGRSTTRLATALSRVG